MSATLGISAAGDRHIVRHRQDCHMDQVGCCSSSHDWDCRTVHRRRAAGDARAGRHAAQGACPGLAGVLGIAYITSVKDTSYRCVGQSRYFRET